MESWEEVKNITDGEGDWEMGETPGQLAFVVEDDGRAGVVESDVVE